jgi:hypothetical protein
MSPVVSTSAGIHLILINDATHPSIATIKIPITMNFSRILSPDDQTSGMGRHQNVRSAAAVKMA